MAQKIANKDTHNFQFISSFGLGDIITEAQAVTCVSYRVLLLARSYHRRTSLKYLLGNKKRTLAMSISMLRSIESSLLILKFQLDPCLYQHPYMLITFISFVLFQCCWWYKCISLHIRTILEMCMQNYAKMRDSARENTCL